MPLSSLYPEVEHRLRAYHELSSRAKLLTAGVPLKPTITISREVGCEAYPVAEELIGIAEEITGERWLLVDISLLDAVAKEHHIPEEIMLSLGHTPRWVDDILSTVNPHWKGDADYYKLLCKQVMLIATAGNAVFVGLGAAIITKSMHNCYHFRLVAEHDFKVRSIARRMNISKEEAERVIMEQQKERDMIIRNVLNTDEHLQIHYHAIFNNGKVKNRKIAETIGDFVLRRG